MQALPVLFAAVLALGVGESSAGVHDPVVVSLAVRRVRADQAPLTARRQACQHQGAPARLADHCDSKPARACHRAQDPPLLPLPAATSRTRLDCQLHRG